MCPKTEKVLTCYSEITCHFSCTPFSLSRKCRPLTLCLARQNTGDISTKISGDFTITACTQHSRYQLVFTGFVVVSLSVMIRSINGNLDYLRQGAHINVFHISWQSADPNKHHVWHFKQRIVSVPTCRQQLLTACAAFFFLQISVRQVMRNK